jgi:hypothetical protein
MKKFSLRMDTPNPKMIKYATVNAPKAKYLAEPSRLKPAPRAVRIKRIVEVWKGVIVFGYRAAMLKRLRAIPPGRETAAI